MSQSPATTPKTPSGRREKREAAEAFIHNLRGTAFPNSTRIYLTVNQR